MLPPRLPVVPPTMLPAVSLCSRRQVRCLVVGHVTFFSTPGPDQEMPDAAAARPVADCARPPVVAPCSVMIRSVYKVVDFIFSMVFPFSLVEKTILPFFRADHQCFYGLPGSGSFLYCWNSHSIAYSKYLSSIFVGNKCLAF